MPNYIFNSAKEVKKMKADLSGMVAVVTGGTRGIGLACAEQLSASGATVAVLGSKQETVHTMETNFLKRPFPPRFWSCSMVLNDKRDSFRYCLT